MFGFYLRGDPENWWRIGQDSGHNFHFFWDDGFSHGKRAGNALKTCALESTEVVAIENAQTFYPTPSELRERALQSRRHENLHEIVSIG